MFRARLRTYAQKRWITLWSNEHERRTRPVFLPVRGVRAPRIDPPDRRRPRGRYGCVRRAVRRASSNGTAVSIWTVCQELIVSSHTIGANMGYSPIVSRRRERLAWLVVAINSGRYGAAVGTRNETFLNDFALATRAATKQTPSGAHCAALSADLLELFLRGYVTRVIQRVKSTGMSTYWFYEYRTTDGRREAETVEASGTITLE